MSFFLCKERSRLTKASICIKTYLHEFWRNRSNIIGCLFSKYIDLFSSFCQNQPIFCSILYSIVKWAGEMKMSLLSMYLWFQAMIFFRNSSCKLRKLEKYLVKSSVSKQFPELWHLNVVCKDISFVVEKITHCHLISSFLNWI